VKLHEFLDMIDKMENTERRDLLNKVV